MVVGIFINVGRSYGVCYHTNITCDVKMKVFGTSNGLGQRRTIVENLKIFPTRSRSEILEIVCRNHNF